MESIRVRLMTNNVLFKSDHIIVKLRMQINAMQYLDGKHSGTDNNDFCCFMPVIQSSLTEVET